MSPELDKSAQRIPEGARRLPDITIGGKSPLELESKLGRIDNVVRSVLRSPDFTTLPNQQTISLVKIKVADLGLTGNPTTNEIYARANELGLDLCPAEVGPWLRLAYKFDQPIGERLCVAMKPIAGSSGNTFTFFVDHEDPYEGEGLCLDCFSVKPDKRWNPEDLFAFALRK
jgi:hypothetical protein